jgi:hypothetical protein
VTDPLVTFTTLIRLSHLRAAQAWLRGQMRIPLVGRLLAGNELVQAILAWESKE